MAPRADVRAKSFHVGIARYGRVHFARRTHPWLHPTLLTLAPCPHLGPVGTFLAQAPLTTILTNLKLTLGENTENSKGG